MGDTDRVMEGPLGSHLLLCTSSTSAGPEKRYLGQHDKKTTIITGAVQGVGSERAVDSGTTVKG